VEFCTAFIVNWHPEESDEVANEKCSCHSSIFFCAEGLLAARACFDQAQSAFILDSNDMIQPVN
jgi:hypothetical protein